MYFQQHADALELQSDERQQRVKRNNLFTAIILFVSATFLVAAVKLFSSKSPADLAVNLAKRNKIKSKFAFSPKIQTKNSKPFNSLKAAESYKPALDYEDPCDVDVLRKECCVDPSYPVLGGIDLVHYRVTGELVFGNPLHKAELSGISRTYSFWFADKSSVSVFESTPEVFLPKWGGFNAGDFCSAYESNFEVLIEETVDLAAAVEVDRHIAFFDAPIDIASCDKRFNSFYGLPQNGVFNTRCVSMKNFQLPVTGLISSMQLFQFPMTGSPYKMAVNALQSLPVKMSELYGVQPSHFAGLETVPKPGLYPTDEPQLDVFKESQIQSIKEDSVDIVQSMSQPTQVFSAPSFELQQSAYSEYPLLQKASPVKLPTTDNVATSAQHPLTPVYVSPEPDNFGTQTEFPFTPVFSTERLAAPNNFAQAEYLTPTVSTGEHTAAHALYPLAHETVAAAPLKLDAPDNSREDYTISSIKSVSSPEKANSYATSDLPPVVDMLGDSILDNFQIEQGYLGRKGEELAMQDAAVTTNLAPKGNKLDPANKIEVSTEAFVSPSSGGFDLVSVPVPLLMPAVDQPLTSSSSLLSVGKLGSNASPQLVHKDEELKIDSEFDESHKQIGEKALLKRGLELPSQMSPGLLNQLGIPISPSNSATTQVVNVTPAVLQIPPPAGVPPVVSSNYAHSPTSATDEAHKQIGEKALLKRGLELPSQMSPGLLSQLGMPDQESNSPAAGHVADLPPAHSLIQPIAPPVAAVPPVVSSSYAHSPNPASLETGDPHKEIGEKALLKKGLESPSEMSPGLLAQVVNSPTSNSVVPPHQPASQYSNQPQEFQYSQPYESQKKPLDFQKPLDTGLDDAHKPIGEKALLKKGLESPSEMSPGLLVQLGGL